MKVKMSRQMGRTKQWGFGRFFYFKDGCKDRLRVKALKIAILPLFVPAAMFSSMKNDVNMAKAKRSAFAMASYSVSSQLPGEAIDTRKSTRRAKVRKKAKYDPLVVTKRPESKLSIPPGTYVKAVLVTGASDGPVKVRLLEPVRAGGRTLVSKGSVLFGKGNSTEQRLMIDFKKIVLKSGKVIDTSAIACDSSDQMPGIVGSNVNSKALSLAGAFGLNFAAGFSAQSDEDSKEQTIIQKVQSGAALAALEEGKRLSEKAKNTRPRIEIERNQKLLILFTGN